MFLTVFLEEMSIWISRLNKEDPPSPVWLYIIQPIEGLNRTKMQRKGELSLFILELRCPYLFLPSAFRAPGSWAFGPKTYTIGSPGSVTLSLTLKYTTSFRGSPACRQQIVGLPGFYNLPCELVPIIFSSVSLYILFVLFLWTTLINTLTLILTERDYTAKYTRLTGLW